MVVPMMRIGGMEVMVARMARKLLSRGHDVGVTCVMEGGELVPELRATGVRVSEVGAHGLVNLKWLPTLTRHLREREPDVLHVHSGCWFKSALAGSRARVGFVMYTAHGFNNETWQETVLNKAAASLTDQVVAVSGHLGEILAERGLSGERMRVVTNGIDTEQFRPGQTLGILRQRLRLGPDAVIVGTVARLEPIKNQAMLIDAIAQAWGRGLDCHGVLIGQGSLGIALAAHAERLGIAGRVHFWGQERNMAPLYRDLDLFVLTSDAEGTSLSLLEAMASGVCPIATAVGGTPAVIGAGARPAGVLTTPRCSDQLAESIVELASSPERRRQMGRAARQRAVEHFSDEVMIEAYERLYVGGVALGTRYPGLDCSLTGR